VPAAKVNLERNIPPHRQGDEKKKIRIRNVSCRGPIDHFLHKYWFFLGFNNSNVFDRLSHKKSLAEYI
jgi:hypothetical protein